MLHYKYALSLSILMLMKINLISGTESFETDSSFSEQIIQRFIEQNYTAIKGYSGSCPRPWAASSVEGIAQGELSSDHFATVTTGKLDDDAVIIETLIYAAEGELPNYLDHPETKIIRVANDSHGEKLIEAMRAGLKEENRILVDKNTVCGTAEKTGKLRTILLNDGVTEHRTPEEVIKCQTKIALAAYQQAVEQYKQKNSKSSDAMDTSASEEKIIERLGNS